MLFRSENVPKPMRATFSPLVSDSDTVPINALSARSDWTLVSPALDAIASTSCPLFIANT